MLQNLILFVFSLYTKSVKNSKPQWKNLRECYGWKIISQQLKACIFVFQNVTELNLADNPAWSGDKESIKGDKYDDIQSARFICPVVGLEMNGRHRSVSFWILLLEASTMLNWI